MTTWEQHVKRWSACRGCPLHSCRTNVVLGRGEVPCTVLFVAEAPGTGEDAVGSPMVGPAGRVMDQVIQGAMEMWSSAADRPAPSWAITNLLACIPVGDDDQKTTEPPAESVRACAPRLREFVDLCQPRLIVCVGRHAEDWLDGKMLGSVWHLDPPKKGFRLSADKVRRHPGADLPRVNIMHPAHIIRMNVSARGLAVQKCVIAVADAMEEHLR